jgi:hypothetical protein
MINPDKLALVYSILCSVSPHALRTARGRRILASRISSQIGMYLGRVEEFIDEMDGLDLSLEEERQLFMDLAWRGL